MTPAQCRSARDLIGMSLAELAKTTMAVPESFIADFEADGWIGEDDLAMIRAALEAAGVEFIEDGVRLRK
jgi:hypothetical protein